MAGGVVIVERGGSPQFNLALEEALLEAVGRWGLVVVRVWVNPRSVVVGYGLDPCEEVECGEARRLGVPVVRRISGGGAVYHDYGNVNFSLFLPGRRGVDRLYRLGTSIVVGALSRLGLKAHVENVNDVVVGSWKVSGSAAAIRAGSSLFHATLLVSADLNTLRRLVKPRLDRVLRGEVTPAKYNPANLSDLKPGVTVESAVNALLEAAYGALGLTVRGPCRDPRSLVGPAYLRASQLYKSKYSRPGWTYVGPAWLEAPSGRCLEASSLHVIGYPSLPYTPEHGAPGGHLGRVDFE